jgi:hypothetical protein
MTNTFGSTSMDATPRAADTPAARRAQRRNVVLGLSGLAGAAVAAFFATTMLVCGPASGNAGSAEKQLRSQVKSWERAWEGSKPGKRAESFSQLYVAGDVMSRIAASDSFQPRRFEAVRINDLRVSGDTAWTTLQVAERVPDAKAAVGQRVQQVWTRTGDSWRIQHERFEAEATKSLGVLPY